MIDPELTDQEMRIIKTSVQQQWHIIYPAKSQCEVLATAEVDNEPWYTVKCSKEISDWVRQQPEENKDWFEHIDHNWHVDRNIFDVSEEFLMVLRLTWGYNEYQGQLP